MNKINSIKLKTLVKVIMTLIEVALVAICIFLIIGGIYSWLSGAHNEACIIMCFASIYVFYFLALEFWEQGLEKQK